MLTLAGHLFGCIFWGLLIALGFCAVTFLIAQSIKGRGVRPVVLVVLLPFFLWQTVLGVGALYARSYAADVEEFVESLERRNCDIDMQDVAREVQHRFPQIPEKFIEKMSSDKIASGLSMAREAAASIRSSLNGYLLARLGWSALFIAAGVFLLVKTAGSSGRRVSGSHHKVPPRQRYYEDFD